MVSRIIEIRIERLGKDDNDQLHVCHDAVTRTMGVGASETGWERSGRLIFVNADLDRLASGCAAGGIPGTGPDTSTPDAVEEAFRA